MCAYRYEKEPDGESVLIIDGWDGIASDPYSGTNYMLSVDLETPAEVAVGYPLTQNATSGATLGNPIADSTRLFTYGTPGVPSGSPQSFAILDDDGQVFESSSITGTYAFLSSGNSASGSTSNDGIAHWLGYLFKSRGANLDYWNGSTWANFTGSTMSNFTAGVKHYMYVGSDNVLYITNGNYLASLTAATPTSFDPTNSATYTWSGQKLQLPVTDVALSIAEVGGGNTPKSTLLVGGALNAVYPWDKVSSSFALPIYIADSYISLMVSANQNAFIFPGYQRGSGQGRGRIYITNGSQADLYYKVPDYIFGVQDPYYLWGDAIFHRNNLLFSFFPVTNAGTLIQNFGYVWALDLDTKKFRALSAFPTSATFVANGYCLISTLNLSTPGFGYIVAWDNNGSAHGIGYSGTTVGTSSSTASILTDLIPVGTFLKKKTFSQVEYKLRSPLQSGESISIIPIVDGSATTTLTFSPTVTTGAISGYAPVTFQNNQWAQFLITLTGNSATSGARLKELRLR